MGQKGERNFDVSMGAYDGAEVCELIDNFMLLTRTILDCMGMSIIANFSFKQKLHFLKWGYKLYIVL